MMDHYQTLRVPDDASAEQIKAVYRKLAAIYHPDSTVLDKAHADEKMKEINEAYRVLSDPVKRAEYDRRRNTSSGVGRDTTLPKPEISPATLGFGILDNGASAALSFHLDNSGGPIAEINFTYSMDNAWFSIVEQASLTDSFPMKIAVNADASSLSEGIHHGWIDVSFDGETARVALVLQVKQVRASPPPVVRRFPAQVPRWAIVGGVMLVLGFAGLLIAPMLAINPAITAVPMLPSVAPAVPSGKIVFTADIGGLPTLHSVHADGTGRTNLNITGQAPVWSPNGDRIGFVSERSGEPQLYLASDTGGSLTQLTHTVGGKSNPAWSPDGTRIAFIAGGPDAGVLYAVDVQGTNEEPLSSLDVGSVSHFVWSADGQQILFDAKQPDNEKRRVYRTQADGAELLQLTDFDSWEPSWSWNGEQIALASGEGVYVTDKNGLGRLRLTTFPAWKPKWSPDGARIAFLSDRGVEGQPLDLWVMDADGRNQSRLTTSGCLAFTWSPDARWLQYSTRNVDAASYVLEAWILDLATGERFIVAEPGEAYVSWIK